MRPRLRRPELRQGKQLAASRSKLGLAPGPRPQSPVLRRGLSSCRAQPWLWAWESRVTWVPLGPLLARGRVLLSPVTSPVEACVFSPTLCQGLWCCPASLPSVCHAPSCFQSHGSSHRGATPPAYLPRFDPSPDLRCPLARLLDMEMCRMTPEPQEGPRHPPKFQKWHLLAKPCG